MKQSTIETIVLTALFLGALAADCYAGDTYACINSPGDYINYGPPAPAADHRAVVAGIIIAPDSSRYEPRWHLMLDPNEQRDLLFEQVRHQNDVIYIGR